MDKPLGKMKDAIHQQLTEHDCMVLATLAGLPPAEADRIKDGLSLLSALEMRGKFTEDNVGYLVDIFTKCSLEKAASIARDYQTKYAPNTPAGAVADERNKVLAPSVIKGITPNQESLDKSGEHIAERYISREPDESLSPTDFEYLSRRISSDRELFGVRLGLPNAVRRRDEADYDKEKHQYLTLLQSIQREWANATDRKIAEALMQEARQDLVRNLRSHKQGSNSYLDCFGESDKGMEKITRMRLEPKDVISNKIWGVRDESTLSGVAQSQSSVRRWKDTQQSTPRGLTGPSVDPSKYWPSQDTKKGRRDSTTKTAELEMWTKVVQRKIPRNDVAESHPVDFQTSLETKAYISKTGGMLQIPQTGIVLIVPPNALPEHMEQCEIQMRVVPHKQEEDQVACFASNSSGVVELLPNNLKFRLPVKLTLPHCLVLNKTKNWTARIFSSHHETGCPPQWKEQTCVPYQLQETFCSMLLDNFCWKKYAIDDEIVLAKKIVVYAAGKLLHPEDKTALINVGYYLVLPGEDEVVQRNPDFVFVNKKPFFFRKKGNYPLKFSLNKILPDGWDCLSADAYEKEIPFETIALSGECSFTYYLQKKSKEAGNPLCILTVSQEGEQMATNLAVHLQCEPLPARPLDVHLVPDDLMFKTVTTKGGTFEIAKTNVVLEVPPDALPVDRKECVVHMRIIPRRSVPDDVTSFSSDSSVAVELFPDDVKFQRPVKLKLPHCLELDSSLKRTVKIITSHHKQGSTNWEEQKNLKYSLEDESCIIWIDQLCSVKYSVDNDIVIGKKIMVYTASRRDIRTISIAGAEVGYFPDMPGGGELLRLNPNLQVDFMTKRYYKKKERCPLRLLLDNAFPSSWTCCFPDSYPREVPFRMIAWSVEFSCLYILQNADTSTVNDLRKSMAVKEGNLPVEMVAQAYQQMSFKEHGSSKRDMSPLDPYPVSTEMEKEKRPSSSSVHATGSVSFNLSVHPGTKKQTGSDSITHTAAPAKKAKAKEGEATSSGVAQSQSSDCQNSLGTKAIITKTGGVLDISNTGVVLFVPPKALPKDMEQCEMHLRIIPRESIKDKASSNSSVVVELLPNGICLQSPARLSIPHCFVLEETGVRKARIFISHHKEGTTPEWEQQKHLSYHLEDTVCMINLNTFCWVKISINNEIVKAKRLVLYAAARNLHPLDTTAEIHVGYYLDLPDEKRVVEDTKGLAIAHRKIFYLMKGEHPLQISLEKIFPDEWQYGSQTPWLQEITYDQIESSTRYDSVIYTIKRSRITAGKNPLCVFLASQENGQITVKLSIHLKAEDKDPSSLTAMELSKMCSLKERYETPLKVVSKTITTTGGSLKIPDSDVILEIPKNSLPEDMNSCLISMRIVPCRVVEDQVKSLCSSASTGVELLPNTLQLRSSAKLVLPHCLQFKENETNFARIYTTDEIGPQSTWTEEPNMLYELTDSACIVHLKKFCCVKYIIDDKTVTAKRIRVYTAVKKMEEKDEFAEVEVGFYSEIPGGQELLRLNPNLYVDFQRTFPFMIKENSNLKLSLDSILPEQWKRCVPEEELQVIPFKVIASSIEHSHLYILQKLSDEPGNITCIFKAMQNEGGMFLSLRLSNSWQWHKSSSQYPTQDITEPQGKNLNLETIDWVSKNLGLEWKTVCRKLNLRGAELVQLEENYKNNLQEVIFQSLLKWRRREGFAATVLSLSEALRKGGRRDLAETILKNTDELPKAD